MGYTTSNTIVVTKTKITCGKCNAYSRSLGRCIYGKVNPRTKKGTTQAMDFMGANYVCGYNKWKSGLVKEMVQE